MMLWLLSLSFSTSQVTVNLVEQQERNRKYWEAQGASREADKPLLVIGGPWGGTVFRRMFKLKAHGCGDT